MTIPKITPYSGGVANPDGSQTQAEFTQNMFDQLSYEAELSTELNSTVDGINDTAIQVDADAASAAQSASAAEAAVSGLNYQGLWPDTGGSANKGDTYQTQVSGTPTGQYFTALQNTTVEPVGDDVNWREVVSNQSLGDVTNYQAGSVADALAGITTNGAVDLEIGQRWVVDDYYGGANPSNSGVLFFKVVAAGTGTADGGKYIDIDSTMQLEQNLKMPLDPKAWGAKGDGVNDDHSSIQSCFLFATPNGSTTTPSAPFISGVKFPPGRFRVTETLNVPRGIRVEGSGAKTLKVCHIEMDSVDNKPIFDLFGVELSDGSRHADQTIDGLHFTNETGYAIRGIQDDYPTAASWGSIAIKNCHFLACNGDYVIQAGYLELVTDNTFDYAQVGHIKTVAISTCSDNVFYRGISGALVFDSTTDDYTVRQISNITDNSFYECGSGGGTTDAAIWGTGGVTLGGWNIVGNAFVGGDAGVNNVRLDADTNLDFFTYNSNPTNNTFTMLQMLGLIDSATVIGNENINIRGTTSSQYGMTFTNVAQLTLAFNSFTNTANIQDISVGGSGVHNVFDNQTEKVGVADTVNFRGEGAAFNEERYNKGKLQRMQNDLVGADGHIWQVKTSQYARLRTNGFASPVWNNNETILSVTSNSATGRSINAGGTVNASGADYAEYMRKAESCGEIKAGDICGINANGELTDKFDEAISFCIKSTNPSYVGGDDWFTEQEPQEGDFDSIVDFDSSMEKFKARMEDARSKVDRIAFCGQVPVNSSGCVGDHIIPVNIDGVISGVSVRNPTLEQYQISIGKVIKVKEGTPIIIVKVS